MNILLVVVVILLFYYCYVYVFGRPHPKFPPGPLRWPVWGAYLQLLVENFDYPFKAMDSLARRYNTDLLGLYLGPFPVVVACSNSAVKEVLTRREFQGRVEAFVPQMRDEDRVIRGQFFIEGPLWVEQRRFMLRNMRDLGFGTRSKKFEKIIEEEIRDFIDIAQSNIEGVSDQGKVMVPVVFYATFLNLTLHLILGARLPPSMHAKLRAYAFRALAFQRAVDPTTGIINMTPWVRHVAPQSCGYTDCSESNEDMKQFIKELVQEHKDTFITDALRDFCDVYLKEMKDKENCDMQHWFSEEQMVMTFWDLLFPSAMAVTNTMGFAVEFLLHHPQVTKRAQQEIDDVVGSSRLPTLDDRTNLPYTEAVLKETMRRQTLTALSLPHRCTEDTFLQGYFIPKDTVMLTNLWSANMDETVWENPYDFNPNRFLDENGKLKKKDPSMPFGLGKRVCAGETFARQNMFLVFAAMLQNFTPELPEGQPLPDIDHPLPGLNVTPHPFSVHLTPR